MINYIIYFAVFLILAFVLSIAVKAITRGVEAKQIIKEEKNLELNKENKNQNLKKKIIMTLSDIDTYIMIVPYPFRHGIYGSRKGSHEIKLFASVKNNLVKQGFSEKFSAGLGTTRINGNRKFHTKLSLLSANKKTE